MSSEFKWTYYSPNTEIWWDDSYLPSINSYHHSLPSYKYHRADGPFVRVAGSAYIWWYKGEYYGHDVLKFINDNDSLTDEQKALLILEWV
jgi:hypothetical protein